MENFCPAQVPLALTQKEKRVFAGRHLGTSSWGFAQSQPGVLEPCIPRVIWPFLDKSWQLLPPGDAWSWSGVFSEPFPITFTAGHSLSQFRPVQALLFQWEQCRKTFCCLVKLVQLRTWLQGLLWQLGQMIREKAVLPVGVWGVCLCVHMGVCSTEEKNEIHIRPQDYPISHAHCSQLSGARMALQ